MPTSTAGKLSKEAGFTLIELAVVVLIIALLSSLTLPLVTGFGENKLESSARRLAGTVKYLYNESALKRQEYRLVFNLDEGTYGAKILREDGELVPADGRWKEQKLKGDVRILDVDVVGREKFTSGEATTVFFPSGWLEETVVHLKEDDRTMTVRLMPFTGTSEIYDGYREFENAGARR